MKKITVIFDRDGVINELFRTASEMAGVPYELYQCYRSINPCLSEEQRKIICQCFYDPQVFANVPPVKGYEEIARLRKDKRVHLIVNSLSWSSTIAKVKKEWDKKYGIDFFDEYWDCYGKKKQMQKAFVQVEDCLENINRSPAKYKILINQPYNQGKIPKNTFRVDGIPEAIDIIEKLIKNVPINSHKKLELRTP